MHTSVQSAEILCVQREIYAHGRDQGSAASRLSCCSNEYLSLKDGADDLPDVSFGLNVKHKLHFSSLRNINAFANGR